MAYMLCLLYLNVIRKLEGTCTECLVLVIAGTIWLHASCHRHACPAQGGQGGWWAGKKVQGQACQAQVDGARWAS